MYFKKMNSMMPLVTKSMLAGATGCSNQNTCVSYYVHVDDPPRKVFLLFPHFDTI